MFTLGVFFGGLHPTITHDTIQLSQAIAHSAIVLLLIVRCTYYSYPKKEDCFLASIFEKYRGIEKKNGRKYSDCGIITILRYN